MKKPKQNRIDQLIIHLAEELLKIPNFELTQADEVANRSFNFIVSKILSFRTLRLYIKDTSWLPLLANSEISSLITE